jgi:type IV secretion system protein VirD4
VRSYMNCALQDGTAKMVAEQIGYRSGEHHGGKDSHAKTDKLVVEPPELAGPDYRELQIVLGVGSKPARVRKMYAWQDPKLAAIMGGLAAERAAGA